MLGFYNVIHSGGIMLYLSESKETMTNVAFHMIK